LGRAKPISRAWSPIGSIRSGSGWAQGSRVRRKATGESLGRLSERLAVIDAAQSRLTEMTREVVSLKDILANKPARGAFGQGRMEAIVRDGLPVGAYDFQFTLSNRARPDCVVRLPGDPRPLAVDAKFPLKGFSALRAARNDEARKSAQARGAPMSASTSRTSPTAISYPARRRTWR
jgi:DNA recombination protein RmuC